MRNGVRWVMLAAVGLLAAAVGWADKPDDKQPLKLPTKKELMAAKLKESQVILEGIAMNDFDKITLASIELVRVTRANDFLNAHKGEEYRFQLNTFKRAAEAVGVKAKDKNMDGVLLAYNDLTLSCLKCHQAMRDRKFDARLNPLDPPLRGE